MKYYIDSHQEVWVSVYESRNNKNKFHWMCSLSRLGRVAIINLFLDFATALLFLIISWRIFNKENIGFFTPCIFLAILVQALLTNNVWRKNNKNELVSCEYAIGLLEKCCMLSKFYLCVILLGFVLYVFFCYR